MHLNRLMLTAILIAAALSATSLLSQEKFTTQLIPREVLFGNPERADPQISPDGKQLGYLAPVNGVLNVWIRTLGKTTTAPSPTIPSAASAISSGSMTTNTSCTCRT